MAFTKKLYSLFYLKLDPRPRAVNSDVFIMVGKLSMLIMLLLKVYASGDLIRNISVSGDGGEGYCLVAGMYDSCQLMYDYPFSASQLGLQYYEADDGFERVKYTWENDKSVDMYATTDPVLMSFNSPDGFNTGQSFNATLTNDSVVFMFGGQCKVWLQYPTPCRITSADGAYRQFNYDGQTITYQWGSASQLLMVWKVTAVWRNNFTSYTIHADMTPAPFTQEFAIQEQRLGTCAATAMSTLSPAMTSTTPVPTPSPNPAPCHSSTREGYKTLAIIALLGLVVMAALVGIMCVKSKSKASGINHQPLMSAQDIPE